MLKSSLIFFFFLACGILVPWLGIELWPMAVEVRSPNPWITRKFPSLILKIKKAYLTSCFSPDLQHYKLFSYLLRKEFILFWGRACCFLVAQLCLTLCNPMDYGPPGSSMGILQARILEWVVISFSRGSSWPRDGTSVSCIGKRIFFFFFFFLPLHHLGGYLSYMSSGLAIKFAFL